MMAIFPVAAGAQWQPHGLDLSASGNLLLGRFTSSDQVFLKRQEAGTASTQLQIQAIAQWENGRHTWGAGLGYRLDRWAMNRTNLGDVLLALLIIPFGSNGNIDEGWPQKIAVKTHQISLPLSYAYRLSANDKSAVQFSARLLVLPAFAIGNKVSIEGEREPSAGMTAALKKEYGSAAGNFSLMVAPEINLHFVPVPHSTEIYFGLQPFAYDVVQPNHNWMKGGLVLRAALGVKVPLVKK